MSYEEKTDELTAPSLTNVRLVKVAGIGMAALLALSACADIGGDEEDDAGEAAQDQAAQDQAEENGEDPGIEEEPSDEDAADEVPDLEDIEQDIFDASEAQDNVTMTGRGNIWDDEFDDLTEEEDEDAEQSFTIAGDTAGENTHVDMTVGSFSMEAVIAGEEIYLSGETLSTVLQAELDGAVEVDWDALDSEVAGSWVDMTGQMPPGDFEDITLDSFFQELRDGWEEGTQESDGLFSGWNTFPDGEAEERNGQEVWVYAEGDHELVVNADPEEPYLISATTVDDDGGPMEMTFEDWNETEVEVPEGDSLISETELEEILMEHVQG